MSFAWEARRRRRLFPRSSRPGLEPTPKSLGEGGAGSLHLNSDALVEFRYAPVKSAHVSHKLGG